MKQKIPDVHLATNKIKRDADDHSIEINNLSKPPEDLHEMCMNGESEGEITQPTVDT